MNARARPTRRLVGALLAMLLLDSAWPAHAADAGASAEAGEAGALLELRRLQTGHLLAESTLGGQAARLLVDTGAEGTVIATDARGDFAVDERVLEVIRGAGIGGPLDLTRHPSPGLAVGEVPVELAGLHAADIGDVLTGLGRIAGEPVHGILGQDALLARSALLDVGSARLSLREGRGVRDAELPARLAAMGYVPIPLTRIDNGFHVLTVHVDERPLRLVVDSGARLSVLHAERAAEFEGVQRSGVFGASAGGVGGAGRAALARMPLEAWRLDALDLAPVSLGVIDLSAVVSYVRERGGAEIDGVLGLDVLRPHRAIVDLGADVLYLAPVESRPVAGRGATTTSWLGAFLGEAPSGRAPLGPLVSTPLL